MTRKILFGMVVLLGCAFVAPAAKVAKGENTPKEASKKSTKVAPQKTAEGTLAKARECLQNGDKQAWLSLYHFVDEDDRKQAGLQWDLYVLEKKYAAKILKAYRVRTRTMRDEVKDMKRDGVFLISATTCRKAKSHVVQQTFGKNGLNAILSCRNCSGKVALCKKGELWYLRTATSQRQGQAPHELAKNSSLANLIASYKEMEPTAGKASRLSDWERELAMKFSKRQHKDVMAWIEKMKGNSGIPKKAPSGETPAENVAKRISPQILRTTLSIHEVKVFCRKTADGHRETIYESDQKGVYRIPACAIWGISSIKEIDVKALVKELKGKGVGIIELYSDVSEGDVAHLSTLSSLRALYLTGKCGNSALAFIAKLKKMERLNFRFTKVTGEGFVHLTKLPDLKHLELPSRIYGDKEVVHIAKLTNLKELDLSFWKLSDSGMVYLTKLKQLERLRLFEVPITDKGLAHLSKLGKIKELDLTKTKVTDVSVPILLGMKKLMTVHVDGTAVTSSAKKKMKSEFRRTWRRRISPK